MTRFVGLDVPQKLTSIYVVDDAGRSLWRGQCHSDPEQIQRSVRGHAAAWCSDQRLYATTPIPVWGQPMRT